MFKTLVGDVSKPADIRREPDGSISVTAGGGWANTYYGNLELLSDDDARWFAKAQSLFFPFQQKEAIRTFGAILLGPEQMVVVGDQ